MRGGFLFGQHAVVHVAIHGAAVVVPRGFAGAVFCVYIGPRVKQKIDRLIGFIEAHGAGVRRDRGRALVVACVVQRRDALVARAVHIGAEIDEHLHHVKRAERAGRRQAQGVIGAEKVAVSVVFLERLSEVDRAAFIGGVFQNRARAFLVAVHDGGVEQAAIRLRPLVGQLQIGRVEKALEPIGLVRHHRMRAVVVRRGGAGVESGHEHAGDKEDEDRNADRIERNGNGDEPAEFLAPLATALRAHGEHDAHHRRRYEQRDRSSEREQERAHDRAHDQHAYPTHGSSFPTRQTG